MRVPIARALIVALVALFCALVSAADQPQPGTKPATEEALPPRPAPRGVALLREQSGALGTLVGSESGKQFLGATVHLPAISTRVVHLNREKRLALSPTEFGALPGAPATDRDGFAVKECDETFYYSTGYGSPLVYARVIDLAAARFELGPLADLKVMDFGYGSIGHLRLLASLGADVTGIEVEPLLRALYSDPSDAGTIENPGDSSKPGRITLLHGQWPADSALATAVGGGDSAGTFDLITSKNTLKRGYIHPEREADPKRLVHLGVSDEAFVNAVREALKPGGLFVIYNISPAPAPADKPYIPWADGRCPFERAMCEDSGFEILAWDEDDQAAILDWWKALGYDEGKPREAMEKEIFAHFTVMRKARR